MRQFAGNVAIIDGGINLQRPEIEHNYKTMIRPTKAKLRERYQHHCSWNFESNSYHQFDLEFFQSLSPGNRSLYEYYFGHGTAVAHVLTTCHPRAKLLALKMPYDFFVEEEEINKEPVPFDDLVKEAERINGHKAGIFAKMQDFLLSHQVRLVNCSWFERLEDKVIEIRARYPFLSEEDVQRLAKIHFDGLVAIYRNFFCLPEVQRNILFVVAAGNHNLDLDQVPVYPASFGTDNILAVGGVDSAFRWWTDRDDFGANYSAQAVHLATQAKGLRVAWGKDAWAVKSGTSLATPIITALALYIAEAMPTAVPMQWKAALFEKTRCIPELADRVQNGRIFDAAHHYPAFAELLSA